MDIAIDSNTTFSAASATGVEFPPQMGKTMTGEQSLKLARGFCRSSRERELLALMTGESIPYLYRRDAELLAARLTASGIPAGMVGQQHIPYEPPYGDCGEVRTFAVFGRAAWIFRSLELDLTDRQLYYHQLLARFQIQAHGDEWYFIRHEIQCAFKAAQRVLDEMGMRLRADASVPGEGLTEYSSALVRTSVLIRNFTRLLRRHTGVGAASDEQLERELSPASALDNDFASQFKATLAYTSENNQSCHIPNRSPAEPLAD